MVSKMADLFVKVSCTYCQEEINGVRVQCCECPDFDICLQCFAVGAEIGSHKNDHAYKFVDHCAVSIFGGRGAWTGREHLRLLDAAELYSYGNWELVAKHVESRTAEECREEYTARYLDGNIGAATWSSCLKPNLIIDLAEDDGPLSPAALAKLAPLDATPEEARVLGYKPHRDDFEREYNQEAEKLVADLQLEEQEAETDIERALKLAIVDMYIRRLRERQRRKRIVRDYQLVAKYFDNLRRDPSQPLYPKAQKELRDHMRPFTQFLNSGEHERLIASIERERELRHRLADLVRYRSLGLATQEEIVHYEQHVAFQRMQIRQGKAGSSGSAMLPGPNLYLTSENGGGEINSNFTDVRTMWPSESDSGYDSEVAGVSAGTLEEGNLSIWTPPTPTPPAQLLSSTACGSSDRGGGDFKALPMGKHLSQGEIQLCTNLNLQPVTYVTLKSLIIQDNLLSPGKYQNGINAEADQSDGNVKDEVTKFLSVSGWLPGVSVN